MLPELSFFSCHFFITCRWVSEFDHWTWHYLGVHEPYAASGLLLRQAFLCERQGEQLCRAYVSLPSPKEQECLLLQLWHPDLPLGTKQCSQCDCGCCLDVVIECCKALHGNSSS